MTGSPAPTELMKCNCSRSCDMKSCPCIANGLKCTQVCRLQRNLNQMTEMKTDDMQPEFDSDNDDDD